MTKQAQVDAVATILRELREGEPAERGAFYQGLAARLVEALAVSKPKAIPAATECIYDWGFRDLLGISKREGGK